MDNNYRLLEEEPGTLAPARYGVQLGNDGGFMLHPGIPDVDKHARLLASVPDMRLALGGGVPGRRITDRLEALIAFYCEKCGPDYEEIPLLRRQIDQIKAALAKSGSA